MPGTKNKLPDLRDHLFETIEALKDEEKPMQIDRAKAICDVAQTIINSAKVEVEYANVTGQQFASDFFPSLESQDKRPALPPAGSLEVIQSKKAKQA